MKLKTSLLPSLSLCVLFVLLVCGCRHKEAPESAGMAPQPAVSVPEGTATPPPVGSPPPEHALPHPTVMAPPSAVTPPVVEKPAADQTPTTAPQQDKPATVATPQAPLPDDETVDIRIEDNSAGVSGVVAEFIVHGSEDEIFRIISDTRDIDHIFPSIEKAERLEDVPSDNPNVSQGIWKYTLRAPIGDLAVNVLVAYDRKNMTVKWNRVSGLFRVLEGEWSLDPVPGYPKYTAIVYKSFIDAGRLIPQIITVKLNKGDADRMTEMLKARLAESR